MERIYGEKSPIYTTAEPFHGLITLEDYGYRVYVSGVWKYRVSMKNKQEVCRVPLITLRSPSGWWIVKDFNEVMMMNVHHLSVEKGRLDISDIGSFDIRLTCSEDYNQSTVELTSLLDTSDIKTIPRRY